MMMMTFHLCTLAAIRFTDVKEIDPTVKCKAHLSTNDDDYHDHIMIIMMILKMTMMMMTISMPGYKPTPH